jgi:hypothetical protein
MFYAAKYVFLIVVIFMFRESMFTGQYHINL